MRKNELRARSAVKRDLAAVALPTKLQLQKIITELQNLVYSALKTGEVADIESVCRERLLALLNAGTEVAVLKGGRRGQLSSEKVIDEPIQEIMPVRFSLKDSGTVQAKGTADYLRRISGIDPTRTNNEFRKQNAVLIDGLSKEICDTVRKTIVDLTKLGVHVRGGKKEISDILLNAGLDPAAAPRLAETIFRTQTAAAYNAGRWNIVNDSDTAPYIWGFQYCTVRDRRVRPEHRLLEGVRLPKDDPFWKRYLPPNGWNCRCTVLEIWKDEDIASVDFGITGVDPRKRSPKELNLLPAFDGNAGILGYGHGIRSRSKGVNNSKINQDTRIPNNEVQNISKVEQTTSVNLVDDNISTTTNLEHEVESSKKEDNLTTEYTYTVYADYIDSQKKDVEIYDWSRNVLAVIHKIEKSNSSVGNEEWKAEFGKEKEKFQTLDAALNFVLEEIAQKKYGVTKNQIEVQWKNKAYEPEKNNPIPTDWAEFRKKSIEDLRNTIKSAVSSKTADKNKTLVIQEDNIYMLDWILKNNLWLNYSNGEMRYGSLLHKFYVLAGNLAYDNPDIIQVATMLIKEARKHKIEAFKYRGKKGCTNRSIEDLMNLLFCNENQNGTKQFTVILSKNSYSMSIESRNQDNPVRYVVRYNRPKGVYFIAQCNPDTGKLEKILFESPSMIGATQKILKKFKTSAGQEGIKLFISEAWKDDIALVHPKPFNDTFLKKMGKKPGDSVSFNDVNEYVESLPPISYIPRIPISVDQAKKELENRGLIISGNPCDDTILMTYEYEQHIQQNGITISARRLGVKRGESAYGSAEFDTRQTNIANMTRAEWKDAQIKNKESGWASSDSEYKTFAHEDGHQIMYDIVAVLGRQRVTQEFEDILKEIGAGQYSASEMDNLKEFYHSNKDKINNGELNEEELDKWNYIDKIIREFSIYGASISERGEPWGEACAEAYAEVMTKGNQSREFSRRIFAKMIELYIECQRVKGGNDV